MVQFKQIILETTNAQSVETLVVTFPVLLFNRLGYKVTNHFLVLSFPDLVGLCTDRQI